MSKRNRKAASIYAPKDQPIVTISLARVTDDHLELVSRRLGQSRSNIIEHLLRLYGGKITVAQIQRETDALAWPKKVVCRSASLTALALRILDEAEERTAGPRSNVVEALIRMYARGLTKREFNAIEEVAV